MDGSVFKWGCASIPADGSGFRLSKTGRIEGNDKFECKIENKCSAPRQHCVYAPCGRAQFDANHVAPELFWRKQHMHVQVVEGSPREHTGQHQRYGVKRAPNQAGPHEWSACPLKPPVHCPPDPGPEQNNARQPSDVREIQSKRVECASPKAEIETRPIKQLSKQSCRCLNFPRSITKVRMGGPEFLVLFSRDNHKN